MTERSLLPRRSFVGSAASLAATALAGCSTPFSGGGPDDESDAVPSADRLSQWIPPLENRRGDRTRLTVNAVAPRRVRAHREHVSEERVDGLQTRVALQSAELAVDAVDYHVVVRRPSDAPATWYEFAFGSFDRAAVGERLLDAGGTDAGSYRDLDRYEFVSDEPDIVYGVREDVVVLVHTSADENPTASADLVLDTGAGEAPTHAEQNDGFGALVDRFEPGFIGELHWSPPDPALPEWSNQREQSLASAWSVGESDSQFRSQGLWAFPQTATVDRERAESIASRWLERDGVDESSLDLHDSVVELRLTGPFDAVY